MVTGATGFVGSAVARHLLARGESVRVLARPGNDRRNLEGLDLEVVEGDLRDAGSVKRALSGCRTLYHVAADYRLWVRDPKEIYATNVEGTRRILLAAGEAGISRIVYTSSVATLGIRGDGASADEATPVGLEDMIGHYKRSKFLAEAEVAKLVADQELPVVIVNPSTPIGPRDVKPTPTGRMVVEAAAGRMPAFVDTGLNVVHVDDVAAGHLLAHEKGRPGERYILGGRDMHLAEILGLVAAICGHKPPKIRIPHGAVLPIAHAAEAWARLSRSAKEPFVTVDGLKMAKKKMFFSHAKAAEELGYRPRPPEAALKDAIEWFRGEGYLVKK